MLPVTRNQSTFISEYSAPKIELLDLNKFKSQRNINLNRTIEARLAELKDEYNGLVDLHEWNRFVDTFECRIECIMGQKYYLYETDEQKRFLSIISPEEFTLVPGKCLGITELNSNGYYIKLACYVEENMAHLGKND